MMGARARFASAPFGEHLSRDIEQPSDWIENRPVDADAPLSPADEPLLSTLKPSRMVAHRRLAHRETG
jgi:hypothetical protein